MKKLIKTLLIATASIGSVVGSTAAVVSCGDVKGQKEADAVVDALVVAYALGTSDRPAKTGNFPGPVNLEAVATIFINHWESDIGPKKYQSLMDAIVKASGFDQSQLTGPIAVTLTTLAGSPAPGQVWTGTSTINFTLKTVTDSFSAISSKKVTWFVLVNNV